MQEPGEAILFAAHEDIKLGRPFKVVPRPPRPPHDHARLGPHDRGRTGHPGGPGLQRPELRAARCGAVGSGGRCGRRETQRHLSLPARPVRGGVKAVSGEVTASAAVEVQPGPLSDFSIEVDTRTTRAGQTLALAAKGVDAYGNPVPVRPRWFLSRSLGTIDNEKAAFIPFTRGQGGDQGHGRGHPQVRGDRGASRRARHPSDRAPDHRHDRRRERPVRGAGV